MGAPAADCDGLMDAAVRRSQRSWKPSQSCLEGIAHVSRDVTLAEVEMDQMYASHDGIVMQSCLPSCVPLAQSGGVYNADGSCLYAKGHHWRCEEWY